MFALGLHVLCLRMFWNCYTSFYVAFGDGLKVSWVGGMIRVLG